MAAFTLRLRPFSSNAFGTPISLLRRQYSNAARPIHRLCAHSNTRSSSALAMAAGGTMASVVLASSLAASLPSGGSGGPRLLHYGGVFQPHRCDSGVAAAATGRSIHSRQPSSTASSAARISKRTAKQLSTGSLLGLTAGIAISIFSKPLTVLLGLFIASTQLFQIATGTRIPFLEQAESKIARAVRQRAQNAGGTFDTAAWRENVVFRLSFGLACMLAGGFIDM